ncbi:hypothetical protein D3C86_1509950 [compost metagenome]
MFGYLYRLQALPGHAHTFMEGFDAKRFAILQIAFGIVGDHLIENQAILVAIDFDQVALKTLAAFVEGDNQRVMVLLQLAQIGHDFHGGFENLRWLRAIILDKGVGHGPELSRQIRWR